MRRILGTLVIAFGCTVFGYAQTNDFQRVHADGLSIACPKTWDVQSTGQGAIALIGIAPLENNQDRFRENLTIARSDLKGRSVSATEFGKTDMGMILKSLKGKNVIKEETYKVNGMDCYRIMYSGLQGDLHLRYEQRYFVHSGYAYTLNVAGEKDNYQLYDDVFTQILNSFQFD